MSDILMISYFFDSHPIPSAKSHMPPIGVIIFVFVMGFGIPSAALCWRQRASRKTRSFQAEI